MREIVNSKDQIEYELSSSVRMALAAEKTGDIKAQVSSWMEAARLHLRDKFGIDSLTTIEGVRLRHITEQVVKEQREQTYKRDELLKADDMHGA